MLSTLSEKSRRIGWRSVAIGSALAVALLGVTIAPASAGTTGGVAVAVDPTVDVADGATLTITGSGFVTDAGPGLYVAFGPEDLKTTNPSDWNLNPSLYSAFTAISTSAIDEAGGFETTLTASLDSDTPDDLSFAVYTFAAQGSVDRTQDTVTPLTMSAADDPDPQPKTCMLAGYSKGTLTWGVKKSFRDYVTGPIANGTIKVGKPAVKTPAGLFTFKGGHGTLTKIKGAKARTATYAVKGSVRFRGHVTDGVPALLLDISKIRVVAKAKVAFLRADVKSKDMDSGDMVTYDNVKLARLKGVTVADFVPTDRTVSLRAKNVLLTAQGAPAFAGFYEPGTALDPVRIHAAYAKKSTAGCRTS